jgi:glycosyltransferase involved in cell wall biosynthesis
MCCRVPVVATAAGGLPETVVHRKTGLLVPIRDPEALAEAMVRLLEDRALSVALAEAGEKQARERFSARRMVEGNFAVYEELLRTLP